MNSKRRKLFLCREIYDLYKLRKEETLSIYRAKINEETTMKKLNKTHLDVNFFLRHFDSRHVSCSVSTFLPKSVTPSSHVSSHALRFDIKPNISCNQSNSAVTVATTFCVCGDSENKKKIVSLLNPSQGLVYRILYSNFCIFFSLQNKTKT